MMALGSMKGLSAKPVVVDNGDFVVFINESGSWNRCGKVVLQELFCQHSQPQLIQMNSEGARLQFYNKSYD